jgi:hypothetical protein
MPKLSSFVANPKRFNPLPKSPQEAILNSKNGEGYNCALLG